MDCAVFYFLVVNLIVRPLVASLFLSRNGPRVMEGVSLVDRVAGQALEGQWVSRTVLDGGI